MYCYYTAGPTHYVYKELNSVVYKQLTYSWYVCTDKIMLQYSYTHLSPYKMKYVMKT